jgi:hypothetical protein
MRHHALVARACRAGAVATLVLLAASACGGRGDASSSPTAPTPAAVGSNRGAPAPRPESIDDSSPEGAVAGFVAAEAAEAYDLSYGLLTAAERARAGSVDDWRDLHADEWPVAGGEVTGTRDGGDAVTVDVRMRYHSSLEETLGLVPARGDGHWKAVREGDRWRVAYEDLRVDAVYPADDTAPERVVAWAKARQACQPGDQYGGGLVGFPALADRLCQQPGDVAAGKPAELDSGPDADRLVAAFGPEVLTWARVVPLSSPADVLRAVVAPIGDRWTVIGVLDPAPAATR